MGLQRKERPVMLADGKSESYVPVLSALCAPSVYHCQHGVLLF